MTRRSATLLQPGRVPLRLAVLLLVALAGTAPILAATPKDLYTAALTDERRLRAPAGEPATLAQLRDAITAYTEIVRRYPRSGYSDNALWQAAGLAIQAFDRYRQPTDRDAGMKFLRLLEREYPSSSLVPRVADRREQLRRLDEPVQIRAIHREPLADVVRVTIEFDDEVRYDAERLEGPARLFFDFSGTYAPPPLRDATLAYDDGDMVREIRLGRHPGQTTRVVLDIEDVDTYSVYSLYHPYRLIIDAVRTPSMQARRLVLDTSPTLAARGEGSAARDRHPSTHSGRVEPAEGRSLPVASGDPRSKTTGMFSRRAEEQPDAVASNDTPAAPVSGGEARQLPFPPAASVEPDASVNPHTADVAPRRMTASGLLPMPEGWEGRLLDPILPALEPVTTDLVDTAPAISTQEPVTDVASAAAARPEVTPPPASTRTAIPAERDELAWPHVHDVLYPNLGSAPSLETAADVPSTNALVSVTPLRTPNAVAPASLVFPMSMVDVLPLPRVEQTVQISRPAPASTELPGADVAVESFGDAPARPGTETAVANSNGGFSLGRQLGLGVSRIVIDPGHGGYDPGAKTGTLTESALVLDVARRLEARLTAETGIEVILTRRRDAYMPLRARTELANRVGADLFLSIHANAARDRRARGVETYYLDLATDPSAQIVAARENATSREGMHDLPKLVRSITMHNKRDESRDFAKMVQRHLIRAVRELYPGAQDLGVKQAPFVVLIGANMPSVLAEISFLTNIEDAAFLATDAYRDRIADALLQSILEYQRTLKPYTGVTAENND